MAWEKDYIWAGVLLVLLQRMAHQGFQGFHLNSTICSLFNCSKLSLGLSWINTFCRVILFSDV